MTQYLIQLHNDLESAILDRWNDCPPHFFEMGLPERRLDPPAGYAGPPFGFGQEENEQAEDSYLAHLHLEDVFTEVETFVETRPRINMYDHFGFTPEQFPPAERLSDAELDALTEQILRLWAAFNLIPSLPEEAPARVVYPLLIARMAKPTMIAKHGIVGIEFCHYEPAGCPFGSEWCDCKDFA